MKKTTIIILAAAILIGNVSVGLQQADGREIPVRQRPPLETGNELAPGMRPSVEDIPVRPTNDVRPVNGNATPTPVRVRPERVRDAREMRVREKTERRTEMHDSIVQIRERRAEEIRERREAFQTTIRGMRDQARRERAERLADNINRVNENLSSRYDGFLSALELVLDKIEIRIGLIEEERGVDLSTIRSMLDDGRKAISDARRAIIEQKAKIYLVNVESIETIQDDFRATKQEMREDHARIKTEWIAPLRTLVREIMTALREEMAGAVEAE